MSARLEILDAGLNHVAAGFTTRAGGVSGPPWDRGNLALHVDDDAERVQANRAALAAQVGAPALHLPAQVHGAGVAVVSTDPATFDVGEVDALVTRVPGILLGVLVADCVPVLLADPTHQVVATAHAGRNGLAGGVLQATLRAMAELGAQPATTRAVIGPAICGRCYEVPAEMRDEVEVTVPGSATRTRSGTPGLDLPAGASALLESAGLAEVRSTGICTAEDERFYSYRRDGLTGRFAGLVMLVGDD